MVSIDFVSDSQQMKLYDYVEQMVKKKIKHNVHQGPVFSKYS